MTANTFMASRSEAGRRLALIAAVALASMASFAANACAASAAPVWGVKATWGDTHLPPGGTAQFVISVRNFSPTPSSGPITVTAQLPPGVTRIAPKPGDFGEGKNPYEFGLEARGWQCSGTTTVSCTYDEPPPVGSGSSLFKGRGALINTTGYGYLLEIRTAISPSASGFGTNTVTVSGGGGTPVTDVDQVTFDSNPAPFGFVPGTFHAEAFDAEYPNGSPVNQAGTHPFELRVDFDSNLRKLEIPPTQLNPPLDPATRSGFMKTHPSADLRTVETTLPRGMIGNPEATPKCRPEDFFADPKLVGSSGSEGFSINFTVSGCPPETQVGTLNLALDRNGAHDAGMASGRFSRVPVYNLVPPKGVPADFGFKIGASESVYRGHIFPSLDPAQSYAIKASVPFISTVMSVRSAQFTMWGAPADPAHDPLRANSVVENGQVFGTPSNTPVKPLLALPMDCEHSDTFKQRADSWQHPGAWTPTEVSKPALKVSGCDDPRIRFEPKVALQPTSLSAGGPTGLAVDLEVPQRDQTVADASELYAENGDVNGIDTPPIKKVVVTLPEGMTISTSAAQGLGSCAPDEIGLGTNSPVRCPENSRYGGLTIHTPILPKDEPMQGDIYIAQQDRNPFDSFLAMYFVIHDEDRGLLVKLPGKVELDETTGQIKTTFDDLPQFPVSNIELNLKGGVRAALVNPPTCGTKEIKATFYSWHDPGTPVTRTSSYDVTQKADGSPCVKDLGERPFHPEMTAGTVSPSAGSYSPFVFRLQRSDDDQEFSQLGATLPPGLIAKIAGVGKCPDAAIAAAEAPGHSGMSEQLFPSCPASSQIGTSDVGSGVGQVLTYISGKVYLAGPYMGAPLSMVVITPVVTGPYDLGVIAVRTAVYLDSKTAQVSVKTDPFPQIYKGIPVRLRDIRVKVDRPETMLNPTSCNPMAIAGRVTGTGGNVNDTADDTTADLAQRFQAANCAALGFKPRVSFRLIGGTRRNAHPALRAVLRARPGDANIADTTVTLPRSAFLEQGHIRTVCTRVQFAQKACPAGSIYGHVEAVTPLLDEPLQGPVFLRSSNHKLPDLVATLNGQIDVEISSRIDSIKGRIRSVFTGIPDAPVSRFVLDMQGGKKGLIVNSRDLCGAVSRASVEMTGQNGKPNDFRPVVKPAGCKKAKRHKQGKR